MATATLSTPHPHARPGADPLAVVAWQLLDRFGVDLVENFNASDGEAARMFALYALGLGPEDQLPPGSRLLPVPDRLPPATRALPQSQAKVGVLVARAHAGLALWNPLDAQADEVDPRQEDLARLVAAQ